MTHLAEAQRRFLAQVLAGEPSSERLAVYRRNVFANHHDALAAVYPVVCRLVGDAFFREASERFAQAHPSRSGDLHRFGAELAPFLEAYPPARELTYLPDVARLEWEVARAFHAADAKRLDVRALGALSEDERGRVRFRLQPAARLVASAHPILAIWEANQPERDGTPERNAGSDRVLVHREGFTVRAHALSPLEWRFLESIARGEPLGKIVDDPAIGTQFESQLLQWTGNGVIDSFSLSPPR